MALFCVGEEGGLVEDTAVVMEEWGRLGVGAGGALACRRPETKALETIPQCPFLGGPIKIKRWRIRGDVAE